MTVSNQEELASGTLRQARALALMMKSFTLSLMFWAFTSYRQQGIQHINDGPSNSPIQREIHTEHLKNVKYF